MTPDGLNKLVRYAFPMKEVRIEKPVRNVSYEAILLPEAGTTGSPIELPVPGGQPW